MMKALVMAVLMAAGLCAVATSRAGAETLALGTPRDEVVARFGEPQGLLKQGGTELLVYKGFDVKLREGRVIGINYVGGSAGAPTISRDAASPAPISPSATQDLAGATVVVPARCPPAATKGFDQQILAKLLMSKFSGPKSAKQPTFLGKTLGVFGFILIVAGALVAAGASIWFLVRAFGVNVGWGFACLFLPFASLIFLIMHWDEAGKPFLVSLGGSVAAVAGVFLILGGLVH
jgi:hypothetical protein